MSDVPYTLVIRNVPESEVRPGDLVFLPGTRVTHKAERLPEDHVTFFYRQVIVREGENIVTLRFPSRGFPTPVPKNPRVEATRVRMEELTPMKTAAREIVTALEFAAKAIREASEHLS